MDGSVESNKLPMYIGGGIVAVVAIFAMVVVGGQEDKFEMALKEDEALRTAVLNEAKAMKPREFLNSVKCMIDMKLME